MSNSDIVYALCDMVNQFAYTTTFRGVEALSDGGLSALEYAFSVLGECGCKVNSNGTITRRKLHEFMSALAVMSEGEKT